MPARQTGGYTWDSVLQRYRDRRGRIVARDQVRRAIDVTLDATERRARSLTEALRAGSLSLAEWETEMRALVKDVHLYSAAAVRGGWDRMTAGDYGRVGQLIRAQYGRLDAFATGLATGRIPLDGRAIVRAIMYAQAGRGTHEAFANSDAKKEAAAQGGRLECRNVLGDAQHCDECPALTRLGWVPVEQMPLPGHRTCLTRCHCKLNRRIAGGQPPETRREAAARRRRNQVTGQG